ncbi:MAG: GAF domain-containing sensor histidine kinase [Acidobacteriaceae bacterium]|nr:GAF domain-containing sensor histidine kinase [Acidobacteriaceae bacterium]
MLGLRQTALLADAADVLSEQLYAQLMESARKLGPRIAETDRRFLKGRKGDPRIGAALLATTAGAAFRLLEQGATISSFFEQVEYNGRRLAKLNVPPAAVVAALEAYARLLGAESNQHWMVQQLHFCVILTLNNAFYQVRESETKAFYDLFRIELESRSLDDLLSRVLVSLAEFCGAAKARVFLLEGEGTPAGAAWQLRAEARGMERVKVRPLRIPNTPALRRALSRPVLESALDEAWQRKGGSLWSVPLGGKLASGVIQFAFAREYEWLPREQELLTAAAERCWMGIEKAKLAEGLAAREEQVRQLAEHMLQVEEAERRRISRELHDEAGQSLLCVRLQMEMLEHRLPASLAAERETLRETRQAVEHTIIETRRLISALSPAVLEQLGLAAAIRQLIQRFRQVHTGKVKLQTHRLENLPQRLSSIVYRLVQECFNNIAKHSFATSVNISVGVADGTLKLTVADNGIGFDVAAAFRKQDSFGLSGIRERVTLLGGTFHLESTRAEAKRARSRKAPGTKIVVELPIPREAIAAETSPSRRAMQDASPGLLVAG